MTSFNPRRELLKELKMSEFQALSITDRLRHLVAFAHLAPSTHNTQPWRFRIDAQNQQVELYCNPKSILPASDRVGRQTVISLGCALENFAVAANHFGCALQIRLHPLSPSSFRPLATKALMPIATLTVGPSKSSPRNENLYRAGFTRRVVRSEFDPAIKVPTNLQSELSAAIDGTPIRLHTISDSARRQAIAEFQAQADNYVINEKKFMHELGEWLLLNDTDSRVGMPGDGFGLSDIQAERLHSGLLGLKSLEPEDGLRFSLGGKLGIEKSPVIAVLTGTKDTPAEWLAAGRALEHMLLTIQAAGFHAAIHAALVEVTLVSRIFSVTLGTTRPIMALFRIGRAKNPEHANRPLSPRLPLDQIIIPS